MWFALWAKIQRSQTFHPLFWSKQNEHIKAYYYIASVEINFWFVYLLEWAGGDSSYLIFLSFPKALLIRSVISDTLTLAILLHLKTCIKTQHLHNVICQRIRSWNAFKRRNFYRQTLSPGLSEAWSLRWTEWSRSLCVCS